MSTSAQLLQVLLEEQVNITKTLVKSRDQREMLVALVHVGVQVKQEQLVIQVKPVKLVHWELVQPVKPVTPVHWELVLQVHVVSKVFKVYKDQLDLLVQWELDQLVKRVQLV